MTKLALGPHSSSSVSSSQRRTASLLVQGTGFPNALLACSFAPATPFSSSIVWEA